MISTLGLLLNTQTVQVEYHQVLAMHMLETQYSKSCHHHQAVVLFIVMVFLWCFWQKRRHSLSALQAEVEAHYISQLLVKAFSQKFAVLAVFRRQVLTFLITSDYQMMSQKETKHWILLFADVSKEVTTK